MAQPSSAVLSFSDVLDSQLDESLPYPSLKRLLRTLRDSHPVYPKRSSLAPPLSQTQPPSHPPALSHTQPPPPLQPPPQRRTPFSDITNLPPREVPPQQCRTPAHDVGHRINAILDNLLLSAEHPVTWSQLRSTLLQQSESYQPFCQAMDNMFNPDDTLAVPPGCTTSQSSRACVYYSNLFWEAAWREFTTNFTSL